MPSEVKVNAEEETEMALLNKKVRKKEVPSSSPKPSSSPPREETGSARRNTGSPGRSGGSPGRRGGSPARKDSSSPGRNKMGFPFRKKPYGKVKSPGRGPDASILKDPEEVDEDDPVMALFKSRTKQRVRFSLESSQPGERRQEEDKNGHGIKKFMSGALFGAKPGSPKALKRMSDEFEAELLKEIESAKQDPGMVWDSPDAQDAQQAVKSRSDLSKDKTESGRASAFKENRQTRANVSKLLNKARRAQFVHYRYRYAIKCHVKALNLLADYPDDHPTVVKVMEALNSAHHALSSYQNSANIVKMGIKYEDTGELVRALKMYTIAYRIRRDNLSRTHPSLVVLLNMLGSIQIKRGELEEAMQIYELALKEAPQVNDSEEEMQPPSVVSLLTRSVTFREMGTIYEAWGECDTALEMYHRSLKCIAEYKGLSSYRSPLDNSSWDKDDDKSLRTTEEQAILNDLEEVRISRSFVNRTEVMTADKGFEDGDTIEDGGMELLFGLQKKGKRAKAPILGTSSNYDVFFPPSIEDKIKKKGSRGKKMDGEEDFSDVDAATTLHQIAQMHRAKGEYNLALSAYK